MTFRSFLDWLGSDAEPDPKPEKAPSDWREKRKDNRVELESERQLIVHLLMPQGTSSGRTLVGRVRNVSVRGCSVVFDSAAALAGVKLGDRFVASLAVDDFPIPLNVEIVRFVMGAEVGLRFRAPFPRELERLERFLEPRCLGRSLREIDPGSLQESGPKGFRWFQGVNETNLFCWWDDAAGKFVQQQLVFLDRVVEWKEGAGVRTGRIRDDKPAASGLDWAKAELIDFEPDPDAALIDQAKTLLKSSRLPKDVRDLFVEKLEA
jgi:hypothetical protein